MTADAVKALYNLGKSSTFAVRNADKTANGDYVRGLVTAGQTNNAIKAIATWDNAIGKKAGSYVNVVEHAAAPWDPKATKVCTATAAGAAAGKKTAAGLAAYGLKIASDYVNPLIVVSGGVKVANAKDKKTELINQGCAIGGMFAGEKTAYRLLTPEGRALIQDKTFAQKGPIKSLLNVMTKLDKYAANTKSSRFGRIAVPLLKSAAFVCTSVGSYAIGAEIADKINDARGVHPLIKKYEPTPQEVAKNDPPETDINQSLEYIS